MAYRVIQWGTGNTGKGAVEGIVANPALELVGAWVHAEANDGRDVGEICGLGPIGVAATRDKQALIDMDADCVSFMPARTWVVDPKSVFADLLAILRSGKNVANLWWPSLTNPKILDEETNQQLRDACAAGGSTIYTGGMNPGFGTLGLMLMGFDLSARVDVVRCDEFYNNAFWVDAMTDMYGYGTTNAAAPIMQPGVMAGMYRAPLLLMAEAMGVAIDEIVEDHRVLFADERFELATFGAIEKGTVCGHHFKVLGKANGKTRVVIGSVARLRDGDFGEEGFPTNGYRVAIEGSPTMKIDMALASPAGVSNPDHGTAVAVAMTVVNVIPQICEAAPGVLTMLDLVRTPRRF